MTGFHPSPTPTSMGLFAMQNFARQASAIITSAVSTPTGDFIATKYITIDGVTNDRVTIPGKTIEIAIPTCIQTLAPDSNGYLPPGTCNALWPYYPSFGAAMALAIMFSLLTIIHIFQAVVHKKVWLARIVGGRTIVTKEIV
jgi:hypothetical protein